MSSRYLGDTKFRDLLVHSIAGDERIQAAAEAIDRILHWENATIPDLLLFSRLAHDVGFCSSDDLIPPMWRLGRLKDGLWELPENVLDLLAWQLHVDGYELANGIEGKRRMVWESLKVHRKAGTKWAVVQALEAALNLTDDMLTLTEWFEYGGDPFFFRVSLDLTGYDMSDTFWHDFYSLLYAVKNVRSWLEWIETSATVGGTVHIGTGLADRTCSKIYLDPTPPAQPSTELRIGTGLADRTSAKIYLSPAPPERPSASLRVGAGVMNRTLTQIFPPAAAPAPGTSLGLCAGLISHTFSTIGVYHG